MKKNFLNFVLNFACRPLLLLVASLLIVPMAISTTFHTANAAGETWSTEVALKGQTTAVLVNNVNNSGITRFDYNDNGTLDTYEARLVRVAEPPFLEGDPAHPAYIIKGWGWNDNLGWVSFYCDGNDGTDGQPVKAGTNLGAACGNQTYGVRLIYHTASGDEPGYFSFSGYAWNDATGYISMNSTNGGSVNYGLRLNENGVVVSDYPSDPFGPEAHLVLPFAWSQSLTWINFKGVTADIEIQVIPEPTCGDTDFVGVCPDVCIEVSGVDLCNEDETPDDTNYDTKDDNEAWELDDLDVYTDPAFPVADGVANYKIKLQFKDGEGNSISKEALANYDVRIFFEWEDTVKRDQVDDEDDDEDGVKAGSEFIRLKTPFASTATPGGAAVTYKPVFLYNNNNDVTEFAGMPPANDGTNSDNINTSSFVTWDGDKLVLKVKSLAPTSGGNKSRVWSMDKIVYRNNDIGVGGEMNNLKLKAVHWVLKSPSGSEIKGSTPYTNSLALDFRPALEVETFNTKSDNLETKDTLVLYRNVETKLEVKAGENKYDVSSPIAKFERNIQFTTETGINSFDVSYRREGVQGEFDYTLGSAYGSWMIPNIINVTAELPGDTKEYGYTEGITLRSIIAYGTSSKPITYYSNFLPRTDSSIANPVAVVQGSLYGTGRTTQTGIELTGIGDNNTNIVKDTVYENVKKLVRDKNISPGSATIDSNFTCNECVSIGPENGSEEILYVKGDATISSDTKWDGYKVLVVDGGNLYIDGNLYKEHLDAQGKPDNKILSTDRLGLVVIRNTGDDLDKAGNIYIAPNVTNIQAFAVVWGAIFSYDGDEDMVTDTNGAFKWKENGYDGNQMIELLSKQLIWQGGISSNNTIGGVDESNEYYKTGYQILTQNEDNLLTAKQYDLNYFRYFRKKLIYDKEGNAVDTSCQSTEDPYDFIPGRTCDNIDLNDMVIDEENKAIGALDAETNPLYIKYVPPYSKSVIFGKEKSLTF